MWRNTPADIDAVLGRFEHSRDACSFAFEDDTYGQILGMADWQDAAVRALHI